MAISAVWLPPRQTLKISTCRIAQPTETNQVKLSAVIELSMAARPGRQQFSFPHGLILALPPAVGINTGIPRIATPPAVSARVEWLLGLVPGGD
jgi:hypothetical protein